MYMSSTAGNNARVGIMLQPEGVRHRICFSLCSLAPWLQLTRGLGSGPNTSIFLSNPSPPRVQNALAKRVRTPF